MNDRIAGGLRKNKKVMIIGLVLWAILTIVLVLPFTVSKAAATTSNGVELVKLFEAFGKLMFDPLKSFSYVIKVGLFGDLFKNILIFTIFYSLFFFIGFIRTMPKHQFDSIEHGSSDWSKGGEQYQILNKKDGIILAENNYLPLDKRGNVNVLVVGRIRFW